MSEILLELTIFVELPGRKTKLTHKCTSLTKVEHVVQEALGLLEISDPVSAWELVLLGRVLAHEATLGSRAPRGQVERLGLTLRPVKPHGLKSVELTGVSIPPALIEMIP